MPAPPKSEKDESLEALEEFRKNAEPHNSFLGLIAVIARVELAINNDEITAANGALEVLSHIYEADAEKRMPLSEWNAKAGIIAEFMPTVRIPLWVFEALAMGWSRYISAEPGVGFVEAINLSTKRGQGIDTVPKDIDLILRDFVLAQAVVNHRRVNSRSGAEISVEQACDEIASETGYTFGAVKNAYYAERENYKNIASKIGDDFDAAY